MKVLAHSFIRYKLELCRRSTEYKSRVFLPCEPAPCFKSDFQDASRYMVQR